MFGRLKMHDVKMTDQGGCGIEFVGWRFMGLLKPRTTGVTKLTKGLKLQCIATATFLVVMISSTKDGGESVRRKVLMCVYG